MIRLDNPPFDPYHLEERQTLFSGGFFEIGFLLFIAYLLFGPKKLPEIARTLGKGMAELRRASNELKRSLEEEISNLDRVTEIRSDSQSQSTKVSESVPTYGDHLAESAPPESESRS